MGKKEIALFVLIGIPILLHLINALRYTIASERLRYNNVGIIHYILIWLIPFFYILFIKALYGPISSWPPSEKDEEKKKRKERKLRYRALHKGPQKERSSAAFYLAISDDQKDKHFVATFLQDENMNVAGNALRAALEGNIDIGNHSERVREIILNILNNPDRIDVYLSSDMLDYIVAVKMREAIVPIQRLLQRPDLNDNEIPPLVDTLIKIDAGESINFIEEIYRKLTSSHKISHTVIGSFLNPLLQAGRHDSIIQGLSDCGEGSFEQWSPFKEIVDIADRRLFPIVISYIDRKVQTGWSGHEINRAIQIGCTVLGREAAHVQNAELKRIILWPDSLKTISESRADPFNENIDWEQASLKEIKYLADAELKQRKGAKKTKNKEAGITEQKQKIQIDKNYVSAFINKEKQEIRNNYNLQEEKQEMEVKSPGIPLTGKRSIRVFISSTFRDMMDERDEMMTHTWPELRKFCAERHLELVEVDLRWGISEEQSIRNETLKLCLDEIRSCRPFFIGILGERYGWIPGDDAFTADLKEEQSWLIGINGKSLTELEILHGVLNNPEMAGRAFFYFRDPEYAKRKGAGFLSENRESELKQKALKEIIRSTCREKNIPLTEIYHNPKDLATLVLDQLKTTIEIQFPIEEKPDPLDS
jgi:hypothetical protein